MKKELQKIPGVSIETPTAYKDSSGIVTFHIPGINSEKLTESLRDREKVLVSPLDEFSPESTRVSTHVFNTDNDLDRLTQGLVRITNDGLT